MQLYRNLSGQSGVHSYEIGADFIAVVFKGTFKEYRYSYAKASVHHVEQMKILAQRGKGLNTYITRHVRKLYD